MDGLEWNIRLIVDDLEVPLFQETSICMHNRFMFFDLDNLFVYMYMMWTLIDMYIYTYIYTYRSYIYIFVFDLHVCLYSRIILLNMWIWVAIARISISGISLCAAGIVGCTYIQHVFVKIFTYSWTDILNVDIFTYLLIYSI